MSRPIYVEGASLENKYCTEDPRFGVRGFTRGEQELLEFIRSKSCITKHHSVHESVSCLGRFGLPH